MQEITVTSLIEFINCLETRESLIMKCIYRGQRNKEWKLIPSFYRLQISINDNSKAEILPNYETYENYILDDFHRKGINLLEKYNIKDRLDLMVVAQHHGLPTRLLDWTDSPLIALFFAVENSSLESDCCVYEFLPNQGHTYDYVNKNLNNENEYHLVRPFQINERVKAQDGCFILHPLQKNLQIKSFNDLLEEQDKLKYLCKIVIPSAYKESIKKDLDKLNVNRFTIYPDLDGLSMKIQSDLTSYPLFYEGKKYTREKRKI